MNKTKISIFVLGIFVTVSVVITLNLFGKPAEKLSDEEKNKFAEKVAGHKLREESLAPSWIRFQGAGYSLAYLDGSRIEKNGQGVAFISRDPRVTVAISKEPYKGVLDEYGSFVIRKDSKNSYKQEDYSDEKFGKVIVFSKTDNEFEKSLFVKRGDFVYSLSVTGRPDQALEAWNYLLTSFFFDK